MHQPAHYPNHRTVEQYAVAHILHGDYSLVVDEFKKKTQDVIDELATLTPHTEEYISVLVIAINYFYRQTKYQCIHFIRELTIANIRISYSEVPLFRDLVRNLQSIVSAGRQIESTF